MMFTKQASDFLQQHHLVDAIHLYRPAIFDPDDLHIRWILFLKSFDGSGLLVAKY